jgi:hypothetical protein
LNFEEGGGMKQMMSDGREDGGEGVEGADTKYCHIVVFLFPFALTAKLIPVSYILLLIIFIICSIAWPSSKRTRDK